MKTLCLLSLFLIAFGQGFAQDTLLISLQEAEKIFLEKNFLLLAKQYDIEAADAQILQAKLYPNPTFIASLNLIDPENQQVLHIGNTGQKEFALEQILILGGKRKSEIAIAQKNKEIAKNEFFELIRNLKFQLVQSYFTLYEQKQISDKYTQQIQVLDSIIKAYEIQVQKGNLPMKDVIRLKSAYLKIYQERSTILQEQIQENQKLQILLQTSRIILPTLAENTFAKTSFLPAYNEILQIALQNRKDLQAMQLSKEIAALRLRLQRQLVVPDLATQLAYDQRGGAFVNQINVGIALPLPLWNKNKGNIKIAQAEQKAVNLLFEQKQKEIETEVLSAWQNMQRSIETYKGVEKIYSQEYEAVFEGIKNNFRKKNISLLEFVDFFEAYNDALVEYQRARMRLLFSANFINFVVATDIYKFEN